jgi:hypothetical protein
MALLTWARRSGYDPELLESYVQADGLWGDFVAVYVKNKALASRYPNRITASKVDFVNGRSGMDGGAIERPLESNHGDWNAAWMRRFLPKRLRPVARRLFRSGGEGPKPS